MATRPSAGLPKLSRRSRILLIIGLVVLILLITGGRLIDTYVNWLWFGEVGYRSVFSTVLVTRIVLFLAVGALVGGALAINMMLAYRSRPVFVPVTGVDDPLSRYRTAIVRRLRLVGIGIPVVIGLIAGLSAQGDWQLVQLFLHGTSFGQTDPEFGKDIGFYAFTLPFVLWLKNWLFIAVTIAFFGALIAQYIFGGIRLAGRGGQLSAPARVQLAVLIGLFVLLKAFAYFTDRYELLSADDNAKFTGATYTDLNALLPAKLILLCIAVFCALAFFAGAFLRHLQLPAIALVLLVLSSVLIGAAWPAILQQFSVSANALQKEQVPIERNLDATRQAYGLTANKVDYVSYDPAKANPTSAQVNADTSTIPNIRVLDPNVLSPTFTSLEQNKSYFGFPPKLNIDRYTVAGQTKDYIVAAREINPAGLQPNQQDWINEHLVFTHGDGFVYAPADQVASGQQGAAGNGGYPVFGVSDLDSQGTIPVSQPRIYYGLLDNDYAVVGGTGAPREYDSDTSPRYTYTGSGGVSLSSWFNRLTFALHYGERNFLFSDAVGQNSKIIFNRNPRDRVEQVAPWLTADGDPYPAVVTDSDGRNRIAWIVDAYTTLDDYPYSQKMQLGEATNDSLTGVAKQPDNQISYIRNSVKAVVDAYSGKVTLYSVDDTDPVLKAWEDVFPGVVQPSSAIPAQLRAHFRYPEDLFKVQRSLLTQYHVNNPQDFYSSKGFWSVPNDPTKSTDGSSAVTTAGTQDGTLNQPPYYVTTQAPGQTKPTFQLSSSLTSLARPNLAAWMSVSSDPSSYGQFTVLTLPIDTQTQGPSQMQSQFESTQKFTESRTLFNNAAVRPLFGNLLNLPLLGGLLYVEPIYIEPSGSNGYPQLASVLTGFNGRVGFDTTLKASLDDLFNGAGGGTPAPPAGGGSSTTTTPPSTTTAPPSNAAPNAAAMSKAVDAIDKALAQLDSAQKSNDFAAIGQAYSALGAAINEYEQAKGSSPTKPSSPPATPSGR
ncbi:MAG TPA: UPF0182 family protein [Pseudonocardiaceae bacterium]|nr:UPF0182 family protein [Pseudonocardiaceae bacterium]